MKATLKCIFFLLFIGLTLNSLAQYNPKNVCDIKDGRIYFKLDRRWTNKQKKEVSTLFSLDSSLIEKALEGKPSITAGGIVWQVKKISNEIVELSKALDDKPVKFKKNDVLMLDEKFLNIPAFFPKETANYGVNKFTPDNVFHYSDGEALFYLPGKTNAKQIILSGSFNNWSTSQISMQRSSTGWFVKLKLPPGKYQYKYIVDGNWIPDQYNQMKQDDLNGGFNSVVFCYNYTFKLKGYTSSHEAYVAGSFNNWNKDELKMIVHDGGWILPLFLRPGTHAYKFILDNKWMTDPANKVIRMDKDGNKNSFLGIGDTIVFKLKGYTTAKNVILSGDFNGWNEGELVMDKTAWGWEMPYALGAGNYQYKYIVDGKWITDPSNPITMGPEDHINSWIAFKANHTFLLSQFLNAKKVILAGNFNGWSEDAYQMKKKAGIWTFPIYLAPGKYTYKFIVDGKWITDPGNELWEENEVGTGNSVLWIEP
jgi:hypothetical protein